MSPLRKIKSMIPRPIKRAIRLCQYRFIDLFRDPRVPPAQDIFIGGVDFMKVGREFLEHFKTYGGLKPTHRVLDVGCGQGRMALPLTGYLAPEGRYVGFDIVERGIRWCHQTYAKETNFTFLHADLYNKEYNPHGKIAAGEFRFPCEDESFDFIFLTSVFTHMCPADVEHYLLEIARCLKPTGQCFSTFFLLNEESLRAIRAGRSALPFNHKAFGFCLVVDADNVESAIAYPEEYVLDAFRNSGLSPVGSVHHGSWIPRKNPLSYQDIIIARKTTLLRSSPQPVN